MTPTDMLRQIVRDEGLVALERADAVTDVLQRAHSLAPEADANDAELRSIAESLVRIQVAVLAAQADMMRGANGLASLERDDAVSILVKRAKGRLPGIGADADVRLSAEAVVAQIRDMLDRRARAKEPTMEDVVAERELEFAVEGHPTRTIIVSIGKPYWEELTKEWRCAYRITGFETEEQHYVVAGDSMSALAWCMETAWVALNERQRRYHGTLTYLGGREFGFGVRDRWAELERDRGVAP